LSLTEAGTGDTAVGSSSGDGAAAGLCAVTAGDAAFGPCGEGRDDAVDRASLLVAVLTLIKLRTDNTAVGSGSGDCAGTGLRPLAAGLGASGPCGPVGDDTVDGASLLVALLCFLEFRAGGAAVGSRCSDGASAGLGAGAAGLVANIPGGPFGDGAVDRAGVVVALAVLGEIGADLAAVGDVAGDGAAAGLGAGVTGVGAGVPCLPARDDAVDGAGIGVAVLGLLEAGADGATVLGSGADGAGTGLGAGSTGLSAAVPFPKGRDEFKSLARQES